MKINVIAENINITLERSGPVLLSDAVADAGAALYAPCGGAGVCGKCRVICRGELSPLSPEEKELLSCDEIARGIRLACCTYATGDAVIKCLPQNGVVIEVGTGCNDKSGNAEHKKIDADIKDCFLAVDIGTTTVAAALCLIGADGSVSERRAAALNPQAVYGADVITRIGYAAGEGGLQRLGDMIGRCIDELTDKLTVELGVKPSRTVIVGHTVMLHLYAGLDVSGIGRAPFTPASVFGNCNFHDSVILPRCVSGYVGADAVSAALAAGIGGHDGDNDSDGELLCDMGTNGEILYMRGGRLRCCSAAAGPALEGAGIKCGMMAADGAVDRVTVCDGKLIVHTIGDTAPRGICGSGLISVVAGLLELGIIERDGYLFEPYTLAEGVYITPADIRALQLAKGAIRAGIEVLCGDDIDSGKIKRFYISGGFGAGMNIEDCVKIGLIPRQLADRVVYIGNGALGGAIMMGSDESALLREYELASSAEYTELSTNGEFMNKFIDCLNF